jgi:cytochrome c5
MKPAFQLWLTIGLIVAVSSLAGVTQEPGKQVYDQTCAVCHGADASGAMPGVPDLTERQGAPTKPNAELLRSLVKGVQTPGAALAMPPRGGNPVLTENDLRATLDYLRRITGIRTNEPNSNGETKK